MHNSDVNICSSFSYNAVILWTPVQVIVFDAWVGGKTFKCSYYYAKSFLTTFTWNQYVLWFIITANFCAHVISSQIVTEQLKTIPALVFSFRFSIVNENVMITGFFVLTFISSAYTSLAAFIVRYLVLSDVLSSIFQRLGVCLFNEVVFGLETCCISSLSEVNPCFGESVFIASGAYGVSKYSTLGSLSCMTRILSLFWFCFGGDFQVVSDNLKKNVVPVP